MHIGERKESSGPARSSRFGRGLRRLPCGRFSKMGQEAGSKEMTLVQGKVQDKVGQ